MTRGARAAALLCAIVAAAYANSFAGVFQFDDFNVIVGNPTVHSLAAWLADLGTGIRPILKLSYALNWVLGPGETGFHAFNLAVHLANTLLVFTLARMLAESFGLRDVREAMAAAFVAALLFGLHPAQTEAVTYLSGRSASLMALFYLGGVLAYAFGTLRDRPLLAYALAPLLFCLALGTKETAVTFPLALLWWEAARGTRDWKAVSRRQAPHGAILLAAVALLLAHPLYRERIMPALHPENLYATALTQIDAVSYLLLRLVRIYPLNIDPDLRVFSDWNLTLAVEAVALAALCVVALAAMRRRPWWAFGLAWFVLHLLPTNSFILRDDLANDRHLYLASVGLFVAAGIELVHFAGRTWARRTAVTALMVVLFMGTAMRNRDYASEVRLWEQTARVSPGKPRAFNNLGLAYSEAGRPDLAEAAYREALRLHPGYDVARENLERLLQKNKKAGGLGRPS